ncbi:hypothetical protein PSOS111911_14225 [Pseudoalteromonas ostreae]
MSDFCALYRPKFMDQLDYLFNFSFKKALTMFDQNSCLIQQLSDFIIINKHMYHT